MYRLQDFSRRCLDVFRVPRMPIEISYSIGESNSSSLHLAWKPNFEGIAFCLVCDGNYHRQTGFAVVRGRRQDDRGMPTTLLMSRNRIQVEFDNVTGIGDIAHVTRPRCRRACPSESLCDGSRE